MFALQSDDDSDGSLDVSVPELVQVVEQLKQQRAQALAQRRNAPCNARRPCVHADEICDPVEQRCVSRNSELGKQIVALLGVRQPRLLRGQRQAAAEAAALRLRGRAVGRGGPAPLPFEEGLQDFRRRVPIAYPGSDAWPDVEDDGFLDFVWKMLTNQLSDFHTRDLTMPAPVARNECAAPAKAGPIKLQNYQAVIPRLVNPTTPIKRMLYVASTGAGKTCVIHALIEAAGLDTEYKPVVIVPSMGVWNEIYKQSTKCPGPFRRELVVKQGLAWDRSEDDRAAIRRFINKHVQLMTYIMAGNLLKKSPSAFDNRLVLMDEAHNLVDTPVVDKQGHLFPTFEKVTPSWRKSVEYLYRYLGRAKNSTIVGFTATPITDRPEQLIMLLNCISGKQLVNPDTFYAEYVGEDDKLTTDPAKLATLRHAFTGHIAVYDNSSDTSRFPTYTEEDMEVPYSDAQATKITKAKVKETLVNIDPLLMRKDRRQKLSDDDVLEEQSPKLFAVVRRVMALPGKQIVFSSQKLSGAEGVLELLLQRGYKEFGTPGYDNGKGVIYLGNRGEKVMTARSIEQQLQAFNAPNNVHGERIPIAILSDKYAEGVDFRGIRALHFVEQPREPGRYAQVVGRARRFCSHSDLAYPGEWTVHVFTYTSRARDEDDGVEEPDADNRDSRVRKTRLNTNMMRLAGSVALDCEVNKGRTGFKCYHGGDDSY